MTSFSSHVVVAQADSLPVISNHLKVIKIRVL